VAPPHPLTMPVSNQKLGEVSFKDCLLQGNAETILPIAGSKGCFVNKGGSVHRTLKNGVGYPPAGGGGGVKHFATPPTETKPNPTTPKQRLTDFRVGFL